MALFALASLVAAFSAAPSAPLPPQRPTQSPGAQTPGDWKIEAVMRTHAGIHGCAVGDFDPAARNAEIAAAAGDGNLYLIRQDGGREFPWRPVSVARTRGELLGCLFDDVDPTREGLELVAYGMLRDKVASGGPGAVYLLSRNEGEIEFEEIFHDTERVVGCATGDYDPARPGREILVTGASKKVHLLYLEDDVWMPQLLTEITGLPETVTGYERAALIGCADGGLLQVSRMGDSWRRMYVEQYAAAQLSVTSFQGSVLAGREDGSVLWMSPEGKRQLIYEAKSEVNGVALGQIDPQTQEMEGVIATEAGNLVVLWGTKGDRFWRPQHIHHHDAGFRHVLLADVYGGNKGPEIVAVSGEGEVLVAGRKR